MTMAAGARFPRACITPRLLLALSFAGLIGGAVLLYQLDPATSRLPRCLFHALTSLHCPGCGSTRALHALLHGDVPAAVRFNPAVILFLPALACAYLRWAADCLRGRPAAFQLGAATRPAWLLALAAGLSLYWIARNVPIYPLTLLAPPG